MDYVILIAPANKVYMRVAFGDSLHRDEVPTIAVATFLDGGNLAFPFDKAVVYEDYGIDDEMRLAIRIATRNGLQVEYRRLLDGTPPAFSTTPPVKPLTTSHAVDTVHVSEVSA